MATAASSTTMADALRSMSQRNNHAVSLFQTGQYVEALESFNETLRASTVFLREYRSLQLDLRNKAAVSEPARHIVCLEASPASSPSMSKGKEESFIVNPRRLLSALDSSLYTCPIQVTTTITDMEREQQGECSSSENKEFNLLSKLSTCLIFNTALAHHATALSEPSTPRGRSRMLEKARDLYSLAYCYQMGSQRDPQQSIDPLCVLATCNNMGRCYMQLGERDNGRSCFQVLLQCMVLFQQQQRQSAMFQRQDERVDDAVSWRIPVGNDEESSRRTVTSLLQERNDADCFYVNIMALILKDHHFAPAA